MGLISASWTEQGWKPYPSKGPLRFDNPVMTEPHAEVKCVCFQGVSSNVLPLVPVCSRCVLTTLRRTVLYKRRTEYGHGMFSLRSLSVLSAVGRSLFVPGAPGGGVNPRVCIVAYRAPSRII